jgi:hypothetical protein
MKSFKITLAALTVIISSQTFAQYNSCKGKNKITRTEVDSRPMTKANGETLKDVNGNTIMQEYSYEVEVASDSYGNADGNQYDLATDGAFEGNTVAVLHLYTGEGFDFSKPKAALAEKGFSVFRWIDHPPTAEVLREKLKDACQLWVISSNIRELNDEHAEVIKEFFESGKGLYIWGDNQPYYADANFLTQKIFGTTMTGNLMGNQNVGISGETDSLDISGIVNGHLISTGVQTIYEGITIATVGATQELSPLIYGSEDNLVAAVYEQNGNRAIIDGGFTRLFLSWDSAGTGRYVKNAAAWLVNYERFGELVYDDKESKDDKDDDDDEVEN